MLRVANPGYSIVFHNTETVRLILRVESLSTLQAIKLLSGRDFFTDKQSKPEDSDREETPIHCRRWAAPNASDKKEEHMKVQEKMVISPLLSFIVAFANF